VTILRSIYRLALGVILAASAACALVPPNTTSLLAGKRILVIDGTHSSHADARTAMTAKLNQIRTAVQTAAGATFTMTQATNPPTSLANFDIIVFNYWFDNNNTSFAAFQSAFQTWIRSGNKGWVGYHTSGANENNEWNWLRDSVTSMRYILHSVAAQTGKVGKTANQAVLALPIMQALPDSFSGQDEWYEFATTAPTWPQAQVMYYLNEASLATPLSTPMNPHPMAWFRQDERGNRFFYTPLIHAAAGVNSTQGNDFFPSLVLRALEYVAGYQSTSIRLNGKGLHGGNSWMHVDRQGLVVESEEPYRLEIFSMDGKRLHAAGGVGGERHSHLFARPGFYVVKMATRSATLTQRVLAR
jgi:Trehalose utilisation